jgi:hypothetical protein
VGGDEDLHVWKRLAHRGQELALPEWMEMSINFIKE